MGAVHLTGWLSLELTGRWPDYFAREVIGHRRVHECDRVARQVHDQRAAPAAAGQSGESRRFPNAESQMVPVVRKDGESGRRRAATPSHVWLARNVCLV